MAEQIPYGVAVSLINRLASSAFREFGRIYGVMDELENLKTTLESIKVVLSDAEQRQYQDPTIQHWITRFKEVLHAADDLLDDLAIKDLQRKVDGHSKGVSKVRDFFSSENPLVFRAKLARKIEKIRKKFSGVAEDMSKLKLNPSWVIVNQNENARSETSSYVFQSDIIGREENKKEIIDLLNQTHTNQHVSLIAIVGIGGLGKTALAQLIYNDAEVQELFQKKQMWVCVSEDFEVKSVLTKMLKSLEDDKVGDLELDKIQKKLREKLNGQRYMLVLDDVWNESQVKWNKLRTYLMCGGEGSKILVTTRSKSVAQTMGINTPYVLNGLTREESWDLLKKLAFGDDASRRSPNLESIGERIAEKCGGVPLAIRTMGGLLQSKDESEWWNILNGDFWRLSEERHDIMPVLKLSYQNLSLELRQCFAYCSLYPKDWEIQRDELILLWMAQGYLESPIERQSIEDVGNHYVKMLLMRSFFQEASLDEYNDITSFKMHDLMHDLAKSVAGNDCYLNCEEKGIDGRPRHVSFLSSTICSLDSLDASKLRTVLGAQTYVGFVAEPSIIKKLKYLRVLDLSSSSITWLPKSIDKLKHLRYLDLSWCLELISLPESIGNLVSLQTLKLRGCRELEFSIEVITKLINLRHLDIEDCKAFEHMMPAGLGKLTSLQYLPNFAVGHNEMSKSGKLNELKDLNNIRGGLTITNLGLVGDVASESQEANLKAKKYIQRLNLRWGLHLSENQISESMLLLDNLCPHQNLRELTVYNYPGVRFSSWLSSLTNIVEIKLDFSSNCEHLPPLERLPYLKILDIQYMEGLKHMHFEEISDVFFPSLETLSLSGGGNMRGRESLGKMVVNPGVRFLSWLRLLTKIVEIHLNSFSNCEHLPPLERLPCLKSLDIQYMDGLKYMHYEEISDVFFPSLETLSFENCENLRGWERLGDVNNANDIDNHLSLPPFPRLSYLHIWDCPNLTCMPTYPHLVEKLQLQNSSVKPMIETCMVQLQSSSIYPLSALNHLWIGGEIEIEAMAEEWMQNLTSLHSLSVWGSPIIAPLSRHLQHLPAELYVLEIYDVDKLDLWKDEEDVSTQCQAPRCLRPLQKIDIQFCRNLKALPEWICDLQSLREIDICDCPNLESLPEGMHGLTNLQTLQITECPLLSDRCQDEDGEDWPKIAHIPNIMIDSYF